MTDLAAIFKAENIPFIEHGDWRSRVRPGTFNPEGLIVHHTASTGLEASLNVVTNGRPDLNGPLCNVFIGGGQLYLISAGRANHAGAGSSTVLSDLRADKAPTGTARDRGLEDDVSGGNGLFVGFEVLSPGTGAILDQPTWALTVRASAAIVKHLGHPSPSRAIGHAEWTKRKIDPEFGHIAGGAHQEMNSIRAAMAKVLAPRRTYGNGPLGPVPAWYVTPVNYGDAHVSIRNAKHALGLPVDEKFDLALWAELRRVRHARGWNLDERRLNERDARAIGPG